MNNLSEEITPIEYARACGLTIGYVYAQLWDGRLKARKMLGRWLIPASAIADRQARRARQREREQERQERQKGDRVSGEVKLKGSAPGAVAGANPGQKETNMHTTANEPATSVRARRQA